MPTHTSSFGAAAPVGFADKTKEAVSDRAALRPQHVTVIPADRLIVVDEQPLTFTFSAPADLHALHWDGVTVAIECISPDGQMSNTRTSADAYDTHVAPFVALWQVEQDRLTAEANQPPPPPTLADKIAHLADVRWQAEQGGTEWQGHTVETDREAQGKYTAELSAAMIGIRVDPSPWKLGGTFVMLSNADFQAVAVAARAHVMACFAAEAATLPLLDGLESLDNVADTFKAALENVKHLDHSGADT